jgi:hypothetical protein
MNLPIYRPNPPSFLEALTGEAGEASINIMQDSPTGVESIEEEADASYNDSSQLDTGEVMFDDSQELDISLTPGGEEKAVETADEPEEISMDLGDISLEESGPIETEAAESSQELETEAAESSQELETEAAESSQELEIEAVESEKEEEKDNFLLDLDDLKMDDSGQLESNTPTSATEKEEESSEIEDLSLDSLTLEDDK